MSLASDGSLTAFAVTTPPPGSPPTVYSIYNTKIASVVNGNVPLTDVARHVGAFDPYVGVSTVPGSPDIVCAHSRPCYDRTFDNIAFLLELQVAVVPNEDGEGAIVSGIAMTSSNPAVSAPSGAPLYSDTITLQFNTRHIAFADDGSTFVVLGVQNGAVVLLACNGSTGAQLSLTSLNTVLNMTEELIPISISPDRSGG